jgi:hypothetical protein
MADKFSVKVAQNEQSQSKSQNGNCCDSPPTKEFGWFFQQLANPRFNLS